MTTTIAPLPAPPAWARTSESGITGMCDLAEEAFEELLEAATLSTSGLGRLISLAGRNHGSSLLSQAYANDAVDEATVAALVGDVWSSAEFPDRQLDRDTWRWLFDAAGFTVDGMAAVRPAGPVVLWRGSVPERRTDWSWSTDRAVAERFARGLRGRAPGRLYRLVAPPKALLCANNGRDEAEYVVDTRGLVVEEVFGDAGG